MKEVRKQAMWATGEEEPGEGKHQVQMSWGSCLSGMVKELEASVEETTGAKGRA